MRALQFVTALFFLAGLGQIPVHPPHTIPIQGNLSQLAGSPQPYAGLTIQLQNCPSPVSITGYSVIVQQTLQLRADASGVINANIFPNDLITCNGTTGQSVYSAVPIVNGVPSATPQCYQVTSTQGIWNLNTQQPIACTQTPPNPQDAQYRNVNVTGCLSIQGGACFIPVANPVQISTGSAPLNFGTVAGNSSASMTLSMTAPSPNHGVICSPQSGLGFPGQLATWQSFALTANTVTVTILNLQAASFTPAVVTWGCTVFN